MMSCTPVPSHVVLFRSLRDDASALAFPCDERGRVDLDALPERMRLNYYFARAVIGGVFRRPTVEVAIDGTIHHA